MATDQNPAAGDIIKPVDQRHRAGFPRSGRADKGDSLARFNPERHIFQHRHHGVITKSDMVKLDRAIGVAKIHRPRPVGHRYGNVQNLDQPLPRGHGALHHRILNGQ